MINDPYSMNVFPRVTLVGAGPGDPELITLKGIRAIESADAVLYDALVSREILDLIPKNVPSLCVGKRAGAHSYRQEEINELIVEFAYRYGHVVRLKGGDSFVFGRGSEEMSFAEAQGIPTSVVPGISSALAVPASANIPITARGISESFWVVTGTTKDGEVSRDIALAARSSATIVILMGINKLDAIMKQFERHGKGKTPAAIIQNGTTSSQQVVTGLVSDVTRKARLAGIGSPAIIVIGEVVNFAGTLQGITENVAVNYRYHGSK